MKSYSILVSLIIALLAGTAANAKYSGGTGEPSDPYQIRTVEDWQELIGASVDWSKHFILTSDIDFGGTNLTPVARDTNTEWGFQGTPFTGVFDGNEHIIRNAIINMPTKDYVGLFGYVGQNGQLHNLCVENIMVRGRYYVGGIVGKNIYGSLTVCYATGQVEGFADVGGLVGSNEIGSITDCYATCSVIGNGHCIGGLLGWTDGSITSCYASGTVSGNGDDVGGLAGGNDNSIIACYATGPVTGASRVGGLVGVNQGTITACYSRGLVNGNIQAGGFVGWNNIVAGIPKACFWDIQTSGRSVSNGGRGLSTSQMKSLTIYRNAGWVGKGWVINDGLDYPRLVWENSGGVPIPDPEPVSLSGNGTIADPYQVWMASDFSFLSWHISILDAHIVLMANLNMSGFKLYPIGELGLPFTGVFDGKDRIISNADVNSPLSSFVGLFGHVSNGGQINNLVIENVTVNATDGKDVGGLVGINEGTVVDCYLTGSVSGNYKVGGLVGYNDGTITNCYSTGSVNGSNGVGGLVGDNWGGTITNSHSTASVSGYDEVGGLVGNNYYSTIINCYSMANVSGSTNIGGLVGYNFETTITGCFSAGNVDGNNCVGGLVGMDYEYASITNCYSTASVQGNIMVAGLVGKNLGAIIKCYSTGSVSGDTYVGGLVGINEGYVLRCEPEACWDEWHYGTVIDSFWDIQTSSEPNSAGGTPKTTAEMKTKSTFTGAGWDFVNIWDICEGTNYPRLRWQIPAGDFLCPYGVDFVDFAVLASAWQSEPNEPNWLPGCDIAQPKDNFIDELDLANFCENWLEGPP